MADNKYAKILNIEYKCPNNGHVYKAKFEKYNLTAMVTSECECCGTEIEVTYDIYNCDCGKMHEIVIH